MMLPKRTGTLILDSAKRKVREFFRVSWEVLSKLFNLPSFKFFDAKVQVLNKTKCCTRFWPEQHLIRDREDRILFPVVNYYGSGRSTQTNRFASHANLGGDFLQEMQRWNRNTAAVQSATSHWAY